MSKQTMRSIMAIITYGLLLVLVLLKIDLLFELLGMLIHAMKPFFLGIAIAFVLDRPCCRLRRLYGKRLGEKGSRFLAVLSSYIGVLVILIAMFSFVLPKVGESIQLFVSSLGGYISNLQSWANELIQHFDYEGVDLSGLSSALHKLLNGILNTLPHAADHVIGFTGSLVSMLVTMTVSIVFSIYMLFGRDTLMGQTRRLMYAYLPKPVADRIRDVLHLTGEIFANYVSGQLLEACILGGLCAGGMLFIQADYAPLVGIIVGATALVPVAGCYIGAFVSAFLLLMVSPVRALVFLIFLGILQQIEGNVIYPRVVGTSIGLPGIWVLLAVTVGGSLFGLVGILFSVPVMSVIYALLHRDVVRRLGPEQEEQGENLP